MTTTGTLHGTYHKADGTPLTGKVYIAPSVAVVRDETGNVILSGTSHVDLDNTGSFSVALVASDDLTLDPSGVTYTVRLRGLPPVTGVAIPGGTTVDMADVTPVDPAAPAYAVNGVISVAGLVGSVTAADLATALDGSGLASDVALAAETTRATAAEATKVNSSTYTAGQATQDAALTAHTGNTSNPHAVTKAQVGLGSVDNTSDASKPVSTAQAAAIALKADTTALTAETTRATAAEGTNATAISGETTTARAAELALRNLSDSTFAANLSASFAAAFGYATTAADGALAMQKITKVDASGGARAMTLADGAAGQTVVVEKGDSSANTVTITGKIRSTSSASFTLSYQYETIRFDWTGTYWEPTTGHRTKASIDTQILATGDARYAKITAPLVSALTYPLVIGHRGAGNLFPESLLTSYVNAGGLAGLQAIECGDYQSATDGGLMDIHDATVDRTTTGTGNANTFSTAGFKRLTADASSWFGGGWPDDHPSTLPEVMAALSGVAVLLPECKDLLDSTATAICQKITAMGLKDSVILQSFNLTNLQVAASAGFSKMYLTGTIANTFTQAQVAAAGVGFMAIDFNASGSMSTWVAAVHAAGMKAIAYTVDHQYDYDAVIALGFDGVFSNDPFYAARNYAAYRKSLTQWHINGTWGHGMIKSVSGPFTVSDRGSFIGTPGAYRWQPPKNQFVVPGDVCPVPSPAGSYTLTLKFVWDGLPSTTSQGAAMFACAADDRCTNSGGNVPNSYLVKARATGVVQMWAIDGSGTATSLGTLSTTAPSIPTLSSGLTAGVAITSIPVNALTVALKIGHQFVLPTGQVVTLTAAAAVSATTLTVASVTPSAAVVSGASLLQLVTLTLAVTPSNLTLTRADETSVAALVSANTSQRGAYVNLVNYVDTGNTSFLTLGVS